MKISKNGIWIIGDVHGEYDKLVSLLEKLPKGSQICFTGDLIDRGKKSSQMLELIIKNKYFSVLGNHEQMMIDTADGQNPNVYWFPNGGRETLDSYHGLINNKYTDMHKKHLKWLRNLPYFIYFEIDTHKPLVVSHSYIHHVWINKDHEYCKCDGRDILWRHMNNKHLFESSKESENAIFNIFGHTPVKESVITDCYAMIDTGAVYSHKKGYGKLSAIHYPSLEVLNVKQ